VFEDLLYQTIRQPGAQSSQQTQLPSGFQLGVGVRTVATERIFTQGSLQQTANNLDVAISGRGFFQVQLPDGSIAYTRDGSFQVDSQGNIVTASGYARAAQHADAPGRPGGEHRQGWRGQRDSPGQPQRSASSARSNRRPSSIRPACQSQGENLYIETAASGVAQVDNPGTQRPGHMLNQSFIETSNVNVAEELVNMIIAQRAYETQFTRHHHLGPDAPASDADL
jgi:flagellar basal-body rod protein FlgG